MLQAFWESRDHLYSFFFLISGLELSIYTPSGQRGDRIIVTSNTNRNKEYWGSFSFFIF